MYPELEVLQCEYDVVSKMSLVQQAIELYSKIHGTQEVPAELLAMRDAVAQRSATCLANARPVMEVVSRDEVLGSLQQDKLKNVELLQSSYHIGATEIGHLYEHAKALYDEGHYEESTVQLTYSAVLSPDFEKALNVLWGKLACAILRSEWESAFESIKLIRDLIDPKVRVCARARVESVAFCVCSCALFVRFCLRVAVCVRV